MQLVYKIPPLKLIDEYSKDHTLQSVKDGSYDPENQELRIEFSDAEILSIATKQLDLIARDLAGSQDNEDYLSALAFIKTDAFLSICHLVTGIDSDSAREYADYLYRRYKPSSKQAISLAAFGDFVDSSYLKSIEFAFELAVELFEQRNDPQPMYLENIYWKNASKAGITVSAVRRHLNHLLYENDEHARLA